jgi:hypothetical protein
MCRRICVAALATGLVAGSLGGLAFASNFKSVVEIDSYLDAGVFTGTVTSPNRRCERYRLVTVWKRNPGAMNGPMGTTKTGKSGSWKLHVSAAPGSYFATVKPRVIHRNGRRRTCAFDYSPNFVIP